MSQRQSIQRYFGDLEVVDADFDILIQPTEDDIKQAIPKDPANCAYAVCARRLWQSTAALFYRKISYIDLVIDGVRKLYRFRHDDGVYERIVHFDKTSKMLPEAMRLRRPLDCGTLEGLRLAAERRKYQKTRPLKKRKAHIQGHKTEGPAIHIDASELRSGTGMVHFRKIKPK